VRQISIWLQGARPGTLVAAVSPVLVGTALARQQGHFSSSIFVITVVLALLVQIGTNLANDYSDSRRGADDARRKGPARVTSSGMASPAQVLAMSGTTFCAAGACALYLAIVAAWPMLPATAVSIAAGILYTGGPRPYGYEGLGEIFVFLFFGIVTVEGSYLVQSRSLSWDALILGAPVGLLAAAILMVNNIRDIETDGRAGKRTLAVRIGRARSKLLYVATIGAAFLVAQVPWLTGKQSPWLLLVLISLPIAVAPARRVYTSSDGPSLNRALVQTGGLLLSFSVLLSAAILVAGK
jgi:1,4-dihydroxy-2-naphthoate polyprenyltransferase